MKKILVTGGAGFIGSNFINYMLMKHNNIFIYNVDKLTYAANKNNVTNGKSYNYEFQKEDICNEKSMKYIFRKFKPDYVVNFAAESHVDRSILTPDVFVKSNVMGTNTLLEISRLNNVKKFIQISTDEVYGSLELDERRKFKEDDKLHPNSPYAASKASADLLALSYQHTYGFPIIITRCSNNYGPYQYPEKLIPLMISNAMNNKKLPVYGDGLNVRDWIYVIDHVRAIETILESGKIGEIYNVGASSEQKNIDIVKLLLKMLNKSEDLIEFVTDRPGHDRRYAIDSSKLQSEFGWKPIYSFEDGLKLTVDWYVKSYYS